MSSGHHEASHDRVTGNDPVDVLVGGRVRSRRTLLGMTQEQLAGALNVTLEQIESYECGSQPIATFQLWDIAEILDVPVHFFFEED